MSGGLWCFVIVYNNLTSKQKKKKTVLDIVFKLCTSIAVKGEINGLKIKKLKRLLNGTRKQCSYWLISEDPFRRR